MKNFFSIFVACTGLIIIVDGVVADGIFSFDLSWRDYQNKEKLGNVCPNKHTKCTDRQTCCKTKHNSYHCCRYPNAVCCPDKFHCCPHGTTCDAARKRCSRRIDIPNPTVEIHVEPMEMPVVEETIKIKSNDQTCPNNRTKCKDTQTCCVTKHGSYHCCKFENAVCCSDKYHCCPEDSTCDLKRHKCVTSNNIMKKLIPSDLTFGFQKFSELRKIKSEKTCPNNKTKCKDTKTCCITKHNNYYCCPHKNAVCCSDKYQCCPEATTCDIKNKKCVNSSFIVKSHEHKEEIDQPHYLIPAETNPFTILFPWNKVEKYCSDQVSKCPGKKRCCEMDNGKFGCCKFNAGVCCPDLKTCCPHETECDVKNNRCTANTRSLVPIPTNVQKQNNRLTTELCPDNVTECFTWQTCCPIDDDGYGCCKYENATCCADKSNCCPHNEKCDLKNKICVKQDKHKIDKYEFNGKRKSLISSHNFIELKNNCSTIDNCPNSHKCCYVGQNRNGCCPYTSGVCCSDLQTCCPKGSKCIKNGCA